MPVGSAQTRKVYTRLKSARLLRTFVIYGSKEFKTVPRHIFDRHLLDGHFLDGHFLDGHFLDGHFLDLLLHWTVFRPVKI